MKFTVQELLAFAGRSVKEPRAAAQDLLAMGIPPQALWPGLALVVLISTLVSGVLNLISPVTGPFAELLASPLISALASFSGYALTIFGLHWTGRMFGGKGRLADMILAITWFQAVLLLGQLILVVVTLVMPIMGAMLALAYLGAALWVSVNFVDAVHRFDNLIKSFGVIVFALLAVGIGLSALLGLVGFGALGGAGNV